MKSKTLCLAVALTLASCGGTKNVFIDGGLTGSWAIERALDTDTAGSEEETWISFGEDGRMNGCAGVNLFFGEYALEGSQLSLSNVGMTRRLGASMDVERAVTEAINTLKTVSISKDKAYCLGEEGDTLLWLRRKTD